MRRAPLPENIRGHIQYGLVGTRGLSPDELHQMDISYTEVRNGTHRDKAFQSDDQSQLVSHSSTQPEAIFHSGVPRQTAHQISSQSRVGSHLGSQSVTSGHNGTPPQPIAHTHIPNGASGVITLSKSAGSTNMLLYTEAKNNHQTEKQVEQAKLIENGCSDNPRLDNTLTFYEKGAQSRKCGTRNTGAHAATAASRVTSTVTQGRHRHESVPSTRVSGDMQVTAVHGRGPGSMSTVGLRQEAEDASPRDDTPLYCNVQHTTQSKSHNHRGNMPIQATEPSPLIVTTADAQDCDELKKRKFDSDLSSSHSVANSGKYFVGGSLSKGLSRLHMNTGPHEKPQPAHPYINVVVGNHHDGADSGRRIHEVDSDTHAMSEYQISASLDSQKALLNAINTAFVGDGNGARLGPSVSGWSGQPTTAMKRMNPSSNHLNGLAQLTNHVITVPNNMQGLKAVANHESGEKPLGTRPNGVRYHRASNGPIVSQVV